MFVLAAGNHDRCAEPRELCGNGLPQPGPSAGDEHCLAVERASGEKLTYDPRRLQGVAVYRESERAFSEGDRVQFSAPDKTLKIANRELGTIESIDKRGNVEIKLDSGRDVRFNLEQNRHLDYGYAVTSHSSQGPRRSSPLPLG